MPVTVKTFITTATSGKIDISFKGVVARGAVQGLEVLPNP